MPKKDWERRQKNHNFLETCFHILCHSIDRENKNIGWRALFASNIKQN